MKKNVKREILKAFKKLDDNEKVTLQLCLILCKEGISLRNLCDTIGADTHAFEKDMKHLIQIGLLQALNNIIYAPIEVRNCLADTPIPCEVNSIIERLVTKTNMSATDNFLQAKPFFQMSFAIMEYILKHQEDGIDYKEYGRLLTNVCRYYDLFATPDPSFHGYSDLLIMKAVQLVKSKIEDKSLLSAELCTCQAFIRLNGWWYKESKELLDTALAIEADYSDNNTSLSYTYMCLAFWKENYGLPAECLTWAFRAWEVAEDIAYKNYVAIYIAYQLCLVKEFRAAESWKNRIDIIKQIPQYHPVRIIWLMIEALSSEDENVAKDSIIKAEWLIDQINPDAALKARIFFIRAQIYAKQQLLRASNEEYRRYIQTHARHYGSTDGGEMVLAANEIIRMVSMDAVVSGKLLSNETIDRIDIKNPVYAHSVREEVCFAYTQLYRALELCSLADIYAKMGIEFAQETIPAEETLKVLSHVFEGNEGNVPSSVTGEDTLWEFNNEHIQNMMADKDVSSVQVRQEIEQLKERFPQHRLELEVMAAGLKNSYDAIHEWHVCITNATKEQRYAMALQCARLSSMQGLIYDALDYYVIAIHTWGYHHANRYEQIAVLLEYVNALEASGLHGKAIEYWTELEEMTIGTPLCVDVYQAKANALYNSQQYEEAIAYYQRALVIYQPEEGLIDERLMSMNAFISCCYNAIGNYEAAYQTAVKAIQFFPDSEFEAFTIHYNYVYLCLAVEKKAEARAHLEKVEILARSKEDKESVKTLFELIKMTKKQRQAYFQISEEQNEVY